MWNNLEVSVQMLCCGVLKKVDRDTNEMKRWRRTHRKGKSQTRAYRKIPLHLLISFNLPPDHSQIRKTWTVFLNRWRACNGIEGVFSLVRKFVSFLVFCRLITDWLILLNNHHMWLFLGPTTWVAVIASWLSVTKTGTKFTAGVRRILNYKSCIHSKYFGI